jgi:N-(5'phosphoribosyl)anthranilate (PRA) isomerase
MPFDLAKYIAAAIRTVEPYAVDVAFAVESKPGKKDRNKLRDFIAAATATKSLPRRQKRRTPRLRRPMDRFLLVTQNVYTLFTHRP